MNFVYKINIINISDRFSQYVNMKMLRIGKIFQIKEMLIVYCFVVTA